MTKIEKILENFGQEILNKYLRYCTIKQKALSGIRISRKESIEALKLKKRLNKLGIFIKEE